MTWVAYHSDLSGVATFQPAEDAELKCRRYAMEHHMSVLFLDDGVELREAMNFDYLRNPEPPLLESDLAALVRETLDLQGSVRFWYSQTAKDVVRIEQYVRDATPLKAQGDDLSQALIDYRIKEAQRT